MKYFYKRKNHSGPLAFLKLIIVTLFLFLFAEPNNAQVVSPLQSGHYMPGVTNIRDMAHPPPGLFVIWYNIFINTSKYYDRNGNELSTLNLSQIDPTLPNVELDMKLNAFSTVPALFWASKFTLLGGANYMVGLSPSFVTANGTIIAKELGGELDGATLVDEDGTVSGWGDLFVVPFGLSWGLEHFDATVTYGFYAPTGKYETGADDNMGLGYWTHQFQGYGYYYPVADQSTALMVGLTYELNSTIEDADMTPGSRFSLELAISQYLSERLEVGVHGSFNWQVGDDSGADVFYDPTYHDSKNTLAFQLAYWPWKNRFYLAGKYAFDFGAVQRFNNNYWMVNFIFLTNLLTGQ